MWSGSDLVTFYQVDEEEELTKKVQMSIYILSLNLKCAWLQADFGKSQWWRGVDWEMLYYNFYYPSTMEVGVYMVLNKKVEVVKKEVVVDNKSAKQPDKPNLLWVRKLIVICIISVLFR